MARAVLLGQGAPQPRAVVRLPLPAPPAELVRPGSRTNERLDLMAKLRRRRTTERLVS